jgi:ABC-2 type transport system permease protein
MINAEMDNFKEIISNRNILRSLVHRNLFGVYRNSALGFGWHFVIPLLMLAIYYLVFSQIRANYIDSFWIYLATGLFPFNFMMTNLTKGANCIVSDAGIVKKIYFPREILVLAEIITSLIIFFIAYAVTLIAMLAVGYEFHLQSLIYVPLAIILMTIFSTGCVLLFSSLTVYAHDVQIFISTINILFMFMTPMYFMIDEVSGLFRTAVLCNPFTYFVEMFHDTLYRGITPEPSSIILCTLISLIFFVIGWASFNKLKHGFAERL